MKKQSFNSVPVRAGARERSHAAVNKNRDRIEQGLEPYYHQCRACAREFPVLYPSDRKWYCDDCPLESYHQQTDHFKASMTPEVRARCYSGMVAYFDARPGLWQKHRRKGGRTAVNKIHRTRKMAQKARVKSLVRAARDEFGAEPEVYGKIIPTHNGMAYRHLTPEGYLKTQALGRTHHPKTFAHFQEKKKFAVPPCSDAYDGFRSEAEQRFYTQISKIPILDQIGFEYLEDLNLYCPGVTAFSGETILKMPDFRFPKINLVVEITSLLFPLSSFIRATSQKTPPWRARALFDKARRQLFATYVKVCERQDVWTTTVDNAGEFLFLPTDLLHGPDLPILCRERSDTLEKFLEWMRRYSDRFRIDVTQMMADIFPKEKAAIDEVFDSVLALIEETKPPEDYTAASKLIAAGMGYQREAMEAKPMFQRAKTIEHQSWLLFKDNRNLLRPVLLDTRSWWGHRTWWSPTY